ncbi:hypothetical protein H920_20115 [Fukomys damarensis]|uniref:Uncharacterized protein n=1 Tax=Fukomys damarensis TaxID=885580 RepID=A0A091CMY2_FUKDA|nr:hypothetical protein H920_20115 [Fukomys damarensis]
MQICRSGADPHHFGDLNEGGERKRFRENLHRTNVTRAATIPAPKPELRPSSGLDSSCSGDSVSSSSLPRCSSLTFLQSAQVASSSRTFPEELVYLVLKSLCYITLMSPQHFSSSEMTFSALQHLDPAFFLRDWGFRSLGEQPAVARSPTPWSWVHSARTGCSVKGDGIWGQCQDALTAEDTVTG